VKVRDTRVCAVAGVMRAGADCAWTLSDRTEEMTLDEFIDFLEPQPERPDPVDPRKTLPARGGAICQSAEDWNSLKTSLDQACRLLGESCTYEMKKVFSAAVARLKRLHRETAAKKLGEDHGAH
jgi:hypothetical protein